MISDSNYKTAFSKARAYGKALEDHVDLDYLKGLDNHPTLQARAVAASDDVVDESSTYYRHKQFRINFTGGDPPVAKVTIPDNVLINRNKFTDGSYRATIAECKANSAINTTNQNDLITLLNNSNNDYIEVTITKTKKMEDVFEALDESGETLTVRVYKTDVYKVKGNVSGTTSAPDVNSVNTTKVF